MMTFTIDLTTVHSYHGLHEHLKEVFSLPDGYGRNLDALWDMLHCAFDEPVTIKVKGVSGVRKDLKEVVQRLLKLLAELERRKGVAISYLED